MKTITVLFGIWLSITACCASWWYSAESLGFNYTEVESWSAATNAIAGIEPDTDVFWGESVSSTGPWIDFYWDGEYVIVYAVGSDTYAVWYELFADYSSAYVAAKEALQSNPDFAGAFPEPPIAPVQQGKRLAKGHNK